MRELFELLSSSEWLDGNEHIQVAKGKYELPDTPRELIKKIFRKIRTK